MATEKQKEAARRNIEKAREVQSDRAHGEDIPRSSEGMSTAEKDRLADEGVTDQERDQAWKRIRAAASKYGVHVAEDDWRDLPGGGHGREQ